MGRGLQSFPQRERQLPDSFSPRHLRNRLLQVALVVIGSVILIKLVPGLSSLGTTFGHAKPVWIVLAGLLELGSMLSYVAIFRGVFCSRMGLRISFEIAMAEQAANSLLPAGGVGGLALGGWALHQGGMSIDHIARRSVAFFFLTSAVNAGALVIFGVAMGCGLFTRPEPKTLSFLPAAVALIAIASVLAIALIEPGRRMGAQPKGGKWRARARLAEQTLVRGIGDSVRLVRKGDPEIIAGAVGYFAFDVAAVAAAFAAYGSVPALSVLVVAYTIGQLGAEIPIPGGIGGVDVGLVGVFVVYGSSVTVATAAVLSYHALLLLIPAVVGTIAFVRLRQELLKADEPAEVCRPLAESAARVRLGS